MSAEPLRALAERWADARAAERANFQSYLIELCDALDVARPGPAGGGYQFELAIRVVTKAGDEVPNYIDCYRRDYFAIEAKDEESGRSSDLLLRRAFGQVRNYVTYAPGGMPPFVMVMHVARTLIVWDRWDGNYGDWQAGRRIDLTLLHQRPDDAAFLRAIWTDPSSLDPRARAEAVTKDVAGHLANLARTLEDQGHEQKRVARFIMRCVFTIFAEDIGLLPDEPFRQVLERCTDDPTAFPEQAAALWKAMDIGDKFVFKKLPRFNGHFFRDSEALPLTKQAILILRLAGEADWQDVEPAIFGTLLTRALDPEERHRLGAEFTPREFVERVVRPTVEEPVRERWKAEQAAVLQLREAGKKKDAEKRLRAFHHWLKGLRFLDPACGSGNFLYVTLHIVKRVELEVLRELEEVTGKHEILFDEVHPKQFFGIEIKLWAREIAELVLWIGYHQFWRAHHAHRPQEPILEDTGTIECRDAILVWDEIRHDPSRDRLDPTPRIKHPVTGELVPDPAAIVKYMEYVNPRPATWPTADFIFGNPPYLGSKRMRDALGDGYVDALRATFDHLAERTDYVLYWWDRAADLVATGSALRAGLITTNSITQVHQRPVVEAAFAKGARPSWAVPDHPWVDEVDGAAVRVAMTVMALNPPSALLVEVSDSGEIVRTAAVKALNPDFSAHANVASTAGTPLLANEGISSMGFALYGPGFIVEEQAAQALLAEQPRTSWVLRPYRNGKDLAARPRNAYVIDFGYMTEDEARQYPVLFDIVRARVKPDRDANRRDTIREFWWRFGWPRKELRTALHGLPRYIATPETAKHRFFVFLDERVAPDNMLIAIASADAWHLGVLSSSIHVSWALAAGGTLEDRPRYNKSVCFDPFPLPDPPSDLREKIGKVAEKLDAHRRAAIERDRAVTMTRMYNVVEKLKSGEPLTPMERKIHEIAACGILKDLHEDLDALVANAYGWTWPIEGEVMLERLVALHDERLKEEQSGRVRWLRPDFQIPLFGKALAVAPPSLGLTEGAPATPKRTKRPVWPTDVISQIGAIKQLLSAEALTAEEVASRFSGAKIDIVRRHLDILQVMGEAQQNPDGRYQGAA
ncbi:MAG: hypothetical protein Q8Q14_01400 [Gemmatimonadales bacterium]|nr:hypothetical protein [Gemmatimonadales bacterium]